MNRTIIIVAVVILASLIVGALWSTNIDTWLSGFGIGRQTAETQPVVYRPNIVVQPLSFCDCPVTECGVPEPGIDVPPDDMPPHTYTPTPTPVPVTPPTPEEPLPDDDTPIPVPPDDETGQPPYRWRWNCQNDDAPEIVPPMPGKGK